VRALRQRRRPQAPGAAARQAGGGRMTAYPICFRSSRTSDRTRPQSRSMPALAFLLEHDGLTAVLEDDALEQATTRPSTSSRRGTSITVQDELLRFGPGGGTYHIMTRAAETEGQLFALE